MADCHANAHSGNCLVSYRNKFYNLTKYLRQVACSRILLENVIPKPITYSQGMILFYFSIGGYHFE